ncbi:FtsX-like permease family protein [Demequina salsinemoris]|uniref:FtsX-like permease family protein n=1 Tax=Demequina salsinemoris TaxID=577470 RepID=UPI000785C4B5|nr:ABC transporter permease [Demequina salsinemoris]
MIGQLLRENLRAHRPYLIWTTVLLALATTMASFAAFTAAQQQIGASAYVNEVYGLDGSWSGKASAVEGWAEDGLAAIQLDDVNQALEAADDEGAGVVAQAGMAVYLSSATELLALDDIEPAADPLYSVASTTGDVQWDQLLLDGTEPGASEVVVSADWAARNDVEIGDTVHVTMEQWDGYSAEPEWVPLGDLRVSGLLRTNLPDTYNMWTYEAFVGWDALPDLETAARDEGMTSIASVEVSAETLTPALSYFIPTQSHADYWVRNGSTASVYLAVAAAVLALGLVGMAFAAGRAQAQARTHWIATARVLGARRSHLVGATGLEALAVGMAAALVGLPAGYGATALGWQQLVKAYPDALIPPSLAIPPWVGLALLALPLTIAAIVGAVPAFWAAKVTPAAALKPVAPMSTAQVSRPVPLWPLLALWAPLALLTSTSISAVLNESGWAGFLASTMLGWITIGALWAATAVASIMLVIEIARRAVAATTALLGRGRRPWQIAAADALAGRPRQGSGPAAVIAVAAAASIGLLTWLGLAAWAQAEAGTLSDDSPVRLFASAYNWGWGDGTQPTEQWAMILAFGTLVLVALATFLAGRAATRAEADAQAALGLDGGSARASAAVEFALPLVVGLAVGTLAGVAGAVGVFHRYVGLYTWVDESTQVLDAHEVGPWWALTHLTHAAVPVVEIVLVALLWIAAGAAVAAVTTKVTARPLARRGA